MSTGVARLEKLREAVGHLERSPAALELASALISLGSELRRAGLPQDAADGLYRGLETAVQCGAAPLVQRARAELSAAGLRPRQLTQDDSETLTAQELSAARLAAVGLTDRGIAEETGLTRSTVRHLLSAVYRKLGTDPAGLPALLKRLDG